MITVNADVNIERPLPEVFAFLEDVENHPTWVRGMQWCRWTSDPPVGVGSTYDQVATFLGKETASSFVVTEHVAGKGISVKTTMSAVPITLTRTMTASASGCTHLQETLEYQPRGVYKVAPHLLQSKVQRAVRRDHERLKRLLETGSV